MYLPGEQATVGTLIPLTDQTFQHEVLESAQPVLVEFSAPWCPPCKRLAPVLHELSAEYAGRIRFAEIDTDEHIDTAAAHAVQIMPTLILFRGGREVQRLIGFVPKDKLKRQIDSALALSTV
jgi:thioredoxin 1